MSKRVLITGVGGFIGSHCLSHLLVSTDWEIIGLDSWRHKGISERLTFNEHYIKHRDRVKIFTHNLITPLSPILIDAIGSVDYIINFASQSHVDRSITDPVPFVQNNVNLALNMIEYARLVKPEKFIQISTDEVYGPTDGKTLHKEWDVIRPSNPYSASKVCQEALVISAWRTYDVPVIITNIMNTIGEMQDAEKFLPMVIKRVLNGEKVTVHADKTLTKSGARFWLHARNTSDAILFLLKNVPVKHYPDYDKPERFNIVGEEQISNLEIAQMVAKIVGKELVYEMVDSETSRPGHDMFYGLDGTKLKEYGYEFPKNFHDSLEKTIQWTLNNERWLK